MRMSRAKRIAEVLAGLGLYQWVKLYTDHYGLGWLKWPIIAVLSLWLINGFHVLGSLFLS